MSDLENQNGVLRITLDGKEISANKGELIIQAAERAGVFVPRFCYHPRMSSVGVCRMCLVEVKGPRGFSLQPSCFLTVAPGMEVVTNSEKVKKAQDGVLEFLLINHPLDCPVCDKGGECPLQDQVLAYGPGESRFVEEKRHFEKPIALSDLVLLDRERCIQCDRCTRFASEVALDPLIDFVGRGDHLEINTFPNTPFSSYFSGNTVQICPVGALTAKPYRFKARPWDLSQTESTCTTCSVGCRMAVQFSRGELTRYMGLDSDAINHSWLCDRGRFGYEATNSNERIEFPLMRFGTELVKVSWRDAIGKIGNSIRRVSAEKGSDSIGFVGGSSFTNEGLYSFVKLAKEFLSTDNFDARLAAGLSPDTVFSSNRTTIDGAMSSKVLVVITGDVREELPILYLRMVEAKKSGLKIVEVSPFETSISKLSDLRIELGNIEFLKALVDNGDTSLTQLLQLVRSECGATGHGLTCLIGQSNLAQAASVCDVLVGNLSRVWPDASFLFSMNGGNIFGAFDLGAVPGYMAGRTPVTLANEPKRVGLSTREMLQKAISGEMLLFVLATDVLAEVGDTDLVRKALTTSQVVVIDAYKSTMFDFADVVLPIAAFGEVSGTTTNLEGRVSRMGQALVPRGTVKPDYAVAAEIARELGYKGFKTEPEEIFDEIAARSEIHKGLGYRDLSTHVAPDGIVIPLGRTKVTISRGPRRLDPIATPGLVSTDRQGPPSSELVVESILDAGDDHGTDGDQPATTPYLKYKTVENSLDLTSTALVLKQPTLRPDQKRLLLTHKLYSPTPALMSTETLKSLVSQARVYLSAATMAALKIDDGSSVTLRSESSNAICKVNAFVKDDLADQFVLAQVGLGANFLDLIEPTEFETVIEVGVG